MTKIDRRAFLSGGAGLAAAAGGVPASAASFPYPLFDTHQHFYTDDIAHYPFAPPAGRVTPEMQAGFVANPMRADRVLAAWDAAGIKAGLGVQYRTAYGLDNRYVLSVAAQHPGRVSAVVILDSLDPQTPATLKRLKAENGVVGLRLTGPATGGAFPWLDSDAALNTWGAAAELGLTLELMPGPGDAVLQAAAVRRIAVLAQKFPKTTIVLDHFAFPATDGAPDFGLTADWRALRAHETIHYKYTWLLSRQDPTFRSAPFLRHAVDLYGADRILWGSDMGNGGGTLDERMAHIRAATALLTPAETRAILNRTGRKAYAVPEA